jgi:hypothetical protein
MSRAAFFMSRALIDASREWNACSPAKILGIFLSIRVEQIKGQGCVTYSTLPFLNPG